MARHTSLDLPVDEIYRQTLIAKEKVLIPLLQEKINSLLRIRLAR